MKKELQRMHSLSLAELCEDMLQFFFFSSRRRHTRLQGDWSSDVCSSDLGVVDALEVITRDPKMLKKIDFTCGSRVITSSASTTPCAEPPPPRSQKFAGRPPTCATTSTVDIDRPAPLPQMPTLPSSFTYVTPFSRAKASSGSAAAVSRLSETSGCRN